jgi:hypothetical protein
MNPLERNYLAQAYMSAWSAVRQTPCVVNPEPYGWFEVRKRGTVTIVKRVRAAQLLKGLVVLTGQLERAEIVNL